MQIIAKSTLKQFWELHAQAETPTWHAIVSKAEWTSPTDVKAIFGATVDFVSDNRIIFDISGNKYRLIVHVAYPNKRVLIKFIGTHKGIRPDQPGDSVMDNIRAIRNDDDLAWAIAEVSEYFDNPPNPLSTDGMRFDVLSDLIEAYEDKHYPVEVPEPAELIKAHMELTGRSQGDLATLFGSRARASEVPNKKRALTVA